MYDPGDAIFQKLWSAGTVHGMRDARPVEIEVRLQSSFAPAKPAGVDAVARMLISGPGRRSRLMGYVPPPVEQRPQLTRRRSRHAGAVWLAFRNEVIKWFAF